MPRGKPFAGHEPDSQKQIRSRAMRLLDGLPSLGQVSIGVKIQHAMKIQGVNQTNLCRKVDDLTRQGLADAKLYQSRISKWAIGQGEPSSRQIHAIALALNVSLLWLMDMARTDLPTAQAMNQEMRAIEALNQLGPEAAAARLCGLPVVPAVGVGVVPRGAAAAWHP